MEISGLPLRNYSVADSILLRSWLAILSLHLFSLEKLLRTNPSGNIARDKRASPE